MIFINKNGAESICLFSVTENKQRYKSHTGFAICFEHLAAGEIFKTRYLPAASDMPCGACGDLYHIVQSIARYIATERNEVISHSRSEYIA